MRNDKYLARSQSPSCFHPSNSFLVSFLSHHHMVKSRESIIFCRMCSGLNMIWTHCEVYWALDFEPFENEWRAASGIGGLRCVAFFFLDNAALVVTTVAVMEICYTSHRLITRSHRLGTEKKQEAHKANQTTPPNNTTNTKPTKRVQSMKGETVKRVRSH